MYLTNTWPNITFSVQQLSQFLDKPTIAHYNRLENRINYSDINYFSFCIILYIFRNHKKDLWVVKYQFIPQKIENNYIPRSSKPQ